MNMCNRKKIPRYKCPKPAPTASKSLKISILRKKNLSLKRKIFKMQEKKDAVIRHLKINNNDLAVKLEQVKLTKRQNDLALLALKEKVRVYEKNIISLNQCVSGVIFPTFLRSSEELARSKMILNECMIQMDKPTSIGLEGTSVRNNYCKNKVNQVVPMVNGMGIQKPIIALERFQFHSAPSPIAEEAEEEEEQNEPINRSRPRPLHRSRLGRRNSGGSRGVTSGEVVRTALNDQRERAVEITNQRQVFVSTPPSRIPPRSCLGRKNFASSTVTSGEVNNSELNNQRQMFMANPDAAGPSSSANQISPASVSTLSYSKTTSTAVSTVSLPYVTIRDISDNGHIPRSISEINPMEGCSWMFTNSAIASNENSVQINQVQSVNENTSVQYENVTVRRKNVQRTNSQNNLVISDSDSDDEISNCNRNCDVSSVINETVVNGVDKTFTNKPSSCANISDIDKTCEAYNQNNSGIINEENQVMNIISSTSRTKEKIKPCFVPVLNGSSDNLNVEMRRSPTNAVAHSSNTSTKSMNSTNAGPKLSPTNTTINNLVVSLPRTDYSPPEDRADRNTSQKVSTSKRVSQKKKAQGRTRKFASKEQEMAKENVPNSGKCRKRTRSPENQNRSPFNDRRNQINFTMSLRSRTKR